MSFFGSIYADTELPHRARTVYMYLCDRAGGGSCWPGIKTIARDLHLSPRTAVSYTHLTLPTILLV